MFRHSKRPFAKSIRLWRLGHVMGCYVSPYIHAVPSLPLFIFGENKDFKHPPLLPQVPRLTDGYN